MSGFPAGGWGLWCAAGVGLVAAAASCGGSGHGLPASGEAVSCDASMYISNGTCVDFPPFSDAGGPYDDGEDAATDADSGDAGADTPPDTPNPPDDGPAPDAEAGGFVDPLGACATAGDVLFVHAAYVDQTATETETFTALDADFTPSPPPPLGFSVASTDPSVATSLTLSIGGAEGGPPPPGTYPVGGGGVGFDLWVDGVAVGETGTLTIEDAQYDTPDGAPASLRSLLLWFSLNDGSRAVTGCLRYVEGAPSSPGAAGIDGGGD